MIASPPRFISDAFSFVLIKLFANSTYVYIVYQMHILVCNWRAHGLLLHNLSEKSVLWSVRLSIDKKI